MVLLSQIQPDSRQCNIICIYWIKSTYKWTCAVQNSVVQGTTIYWIFSKSHSSLDFFRYLPWKIHTSPPYPSPQNVKVAGVLMKIRGSDLTQLDFKRNLKLYMFIQTHIEEINEWNKKIGFNIYSYLIYNLVNISRVD